VVADLQLQASGLEERRQLYTLEFTVPPLVRQAAPPWEALQQRAGRRCCCQRPTQLLCQAQAAAAPMPRWRQTPRGADPQLHMAQPQRRRQLLRGAATATTPERLQRLGEGGGYSEQAAAVRT
jgi:hypothetical protein